MHSPTVTIKTAQLKHSNAVISLEASQFKAIELTVNEKRLVFSVQRGGSAKGTVVLDSFLCSLNGIVDGAAYCFRLLKNLPTLSQIYVQVSSDLSFHLISERFREIELCTLQQIPCFSVGQRYLVWLKSVSLEFLVESVLPSAFTSGVAQENTLLNILPPKARISDALKIRFLHTDESPTEKVTVTNPIWFKVCRLPAAQEVSFIAIEEGVGYLEATSHPIGLYNGLLVECSERRAGLETKEIKSLPIECSTCDLALQSSSKKILILGQRQSGKSTILRKLQIVVEGAMLVDLKILGHPRILLAALNRKNCPKVLLIDDLDLLLKDGLLSKKFGYFLSLISSDLRIIATSTGPISKDWETVEIQPFSFNQVYRITGNLPVTQLCMGKPIGKILKISQSHRLQIFNPHSAQERKDFFGYEEVKNVLVETIVWPIRYEMLFRVNGMRAKQGVVLWGPSGCGKSLIAQSFANEYKDIFSVYLVRGPELLDKYIGATEQGIRSVFIKARQSTPALIIFDEFDSIAGVRGKDTSTATDRAVNQLLSELDGVSDCYGISVIATVQSLKHLDPAITRSGRLDKHIYVGLPNAPDRRKILEQQFFGNPIDERVIAESEGLDCSRISYLSTECSLTGCTPLEALKRLKSASSLGKVSEIERTESFTI